MQMSDADKLSYKNTYRRIAQEHRERIAAKLRMLENPDWDEEERQGLLDNIEEHKAMIAGCEHSLQWIDNKTPEEQLSLFK